MKIYQTALLFALLLLSVVARASAVDDHLRQKIATLLTGEPLSIEIGQTTLAEIEQRYPNKVATPINLNVHYFSLPNKVIAEHNLADVYIVFVDGIAERLVLSFDATHINYADVQAIMKQHYQPQPLSAEVVVADNTNYENTVVYHVHNEEFITQDKRIVISTGEVYLGAMATDNGWVNMGADHQFIVLENEPDWLEVYGHSIFIATLKAGSTYGQLSKQFIALKKQIAVLSAQLHTTNQTIYQLLDDTRVTRNNEQRKRFYGLVTDSETLLKRMVSATDYADIKRYLLERGHSYWGDVDDIEATNKTFTQVIDYLELKKQTATRLVVIAPLLEAYYRATFDLYRRMDNLSDEAIIAEHDKAVTALEIALEAQQNH